MVRWQRLPRRIALVSGRGQAIAILAALVVAALSGCTKKEPPGPTAIQKIIDAEPSRRARALRDEIVQLVAASKLDEAAGKVEGMGKLVGEILASMDTIHHQKTAVPDFAVVRYIEALRDLGENLRGFSRMYSGGNPPQLKREMLMGMIDLLKNKIR